MKPIKFDKNGEVKPPNRSMERPTSKVNETPVKMNKPKKVAKKFHSVETDEPENNFLTARRKRITK